MNILFMSLIDFDSLEERNIYTDLLREFRRNGHFIFAISPVEKRTKKETRIIKENEQTQILKLKIGNVQKTGMIEKGISTITLEQKFISAIKNYFGKVKFDLVLYPTPPITLGRAVEYVKKRDNAITYLLLKDIFPQNAVDLGMLSTHGWKKLIYQYFRRKEKHIYQISDYIGCMSQANVDYVLKHNPEIQPEKVEVCPNCIEVQEQDLTFDEKMEMRKKYQIPLDKTVFVYGGNLGKPQGIPFMMECIKKTSNLEKVYWLIIGNGTEYGKIKQEVNGMKNVKLMKTLPKEEYEKLIRACDCGMIFLDYRFTIPNFPSRLLSYMQAKLPVIACTDLASDVGDVINNGNFGWWCKSESVQGFLEIVEKLKIEEIEQKGLNANKYLQEKYVTNIAYDIIYEHF